MLQALLKRSIAKPEPNKISSEKFGNTPHPIAMIKNFFPLRIKNEQAAHAAPRFTEPRQFKTLLFREKVWICWGLFFRGLVLFIAYLVAFSGFDALQNAILFRMNLNMEDLAGGDMVHRVTLIDITTLALLGVCFFYLYIRWIFAAKFLRFRVVLVEHK